MKRMPSVRAMEVKIMSFVVLTAAQIYRFIRI